MIFVQFCIFAAMEKIKSDKAVVVKHTGSHYLLSKLPEWNLFPAVIKGKLRLKGSTSTPRSSAAPVSANEDSRHAQ